MQERVPSTAKVAIATLALVLFIGSAAWAATSGKVHTANWPGSPTGVVCGQADIVVAPPDFKAHTYSRTSSSCATAQSRAAGWLGVKFKALKDGVVCYTSATHYNSGTTSGISVGGKVCTDPAGTQAWSTWAYQSAWNPDTWTYLNVGPVVSPNQSS